MRYKFQSTLWVPAPIERVWDFMSDPANLARLTPANYGAQIIAAGRAHNDQQVTIRMRPFGITVPLPWISRIEDVQSEGAKRRFVDIQLTGPFAYWKHEHLFESGISELSSNVEGAPKRRMVEPGTWIRDQVEYTPPLGPLGDLANTTFIKRQLGDLFAYRREVTMGLFSTPLAS